MSRLTEKINQRCGNWILLAVIALASLLRLYALGEKSLGVDESFSVLLSEKPLPEVLIGDLHPPLYHVLLHFIIFLGRSEWVVRFPSALVGIAVVPLTYQFLNILGLRNAGLWAAGIVAVSPLLVHHSQEARMYSLLMFLCLGSLYCVVGLMRTRSLRFAFGYVLTTALALYTHDLAWGVVVAGWAVVLFAEGPRGMKRTELWLCVLAVAVLYLPWIGGLRHHVSSIDVSRNPANLERAVAASFTAVANFLCGYFYYLQERGLEGVCFVVVALTGIVCVRAFIPPVSDRLCNVALVVSLVAPFAMTAGLAWKTGLVQSKYYITAMAPLAMVLGCGLERFRLKRSPLLPVYLCLLGWLIVYSHWRYFGPDQLGRDNWRGIYHYVQAQHQPHDLVVFNGPWSFYPFVYYSRGGLPYQGMPQSNPPSDRTTAKEFAEVRREGYQRVFLIISPGSQVLADPRNLVLQWLKQHGSLLEQKPFGKITVWLFNLRDRETAGRVSVAG